MEKNDYRATAQLRELKGKKRDIRNE